MKKKSNCFIVGLPKCGTTSLRYYLSQHPLIFFPDIEPEYFCKDITAEKVSRVKNKYIFSPLSLQEYMNLYGGMENKKIWGDKSVNYLYSKVAAKEIFNFNPDAKIIAVFREPVSLLYSMHSQMVFGLEESEKKFFRALELESERKKGKHLQSTIYSPSLLYYSERIKYTDQLRRYLHIFPKKNVKILLFDDLKRNTPKAVSEIFKFLEVDNNISINFDQKNPNKTLRFHALAEFVRYNTALRQLRKMLKDTIFFDHLKRLYLKIICRYEPRQPLTDSQISELKRKYGHEVFKFDSFLKKHDLLEKDINLTELWGYSSL